MVALRSRKPNFELSTVDLLQGGLSNNDLPAGLTSFRLVSLLVAQEETKFEASGIARRGENTYFVACDKWALLPSLKIIIN